MGQIIRTVMYGARLKRPEHRKIFEKSRDLLHEWNERHRPKNLPELRTDESHDVVGVFLIDPEAPVFRGVGEVEPIDVAELLNARVGKRARESTIAFRRWLDFSGITLPPCTLWLVGAEVA